MTLDDESMHVWDASIESLAADEAAAERLLSTDEIARAEQFRFPRHAQAFRLCRALLRAILGRYLEQPAGQLCFKYSEHGKPQLAGSQRSEIQFNLSHSGDRVLVAVAKNRAVGVDVEEIRPLDDAEAIARNYFSPAEVEAWLRLAQDERPQAFFRCWTRKEALMKAMGRGLSIGLDQFSVDLARGGKTDVTWQSASLPVDEWTILDLDVGLGYAAAVAGAAGLCRVERFTAAGDVIAAAGKAGRI